MQNHEYNANVYADVINENDHNSYKKTCAEWMAKMPLGCASVTFIEGNRFVKLSSVLN